ncbi:MAG: sugar-binding domain-containing protein [Actinomycetaceae bacterium]|nr:sugar-binding domain-containing protein [Actinomycetaceae bacterium]
MSDDSRSDLILEAAELYYFEGLTQAAIGQRLGCTRWTVGRLLEQARETGLVTITINHPRARTRELETALMRTFAIDKAIIGPGIETASTDVSRAAASFLADMRPRPSTVAVSWGRTLARVALQLPHNWSPGVKAYQTNGGPTRSGNDSIARSLGILAEKGPGIGHTLPAPAIVGATELSNQLLKEPVIAETLQAAAGADVTVYSPGSVTHDSVLVRSGYLRPSHIDSIRKSGGVGDILSHFVDSDGEPISSELDARTISLGLHALKESKQTVAIVDTADKAPALLAAIRAGYASTVITDSETAQSVLALIE